MKRNEKDRDSIRRYLLGYANSEEQEQIEEQLVTDSEYKEQVLIIENELIEDYLADELPDEERENFVRHFLSTPQQIRKLKIAEALDRYFTVEAAAHSPPPSPEPEHKGSTNVLHGGLFGRRSPVAIYTLAAAVLLFVIGAAWLLVHLRQGTGPVVLEQDRDRQFQRDLAALNRPGQTPNADALALTLSPISFRGGNDLSAVVIPQRSGIVQLSLVLPADEYKTYRVALQKSGDVQRFIIDDLPASTTQNGKAVILSLPARSLDRGDYVLELSGSNGDGRFEQAGGYTFRVQN
jgi:hypothetical protein